MLSPLAGYGSHFGIDNIPFGIASSAAHPKPGAVTRFGDNVIFLSRLGALLKEDSIDHQILEEQSLNAFAALGPKVHTAVRQKIQTLIRQDETLATFPQAAVEPINQVSMHLPMTIGDFTDMSCSHHHVQNAAEAMTGKRSAPPAFFNMPIGYAGRCSSIDISGTPVERPLGQYWAGKPGESEVVFGPSKRMDYELELGCIVGKPIPRNQRIRASQAEEHIFGYVLVNDWSARDIQALEMNPLGPLNGKNAASPPREYVDMPYLKDSGNDALDIKLQVQAQSQGNGETSVKAYCNSNSAWLYWTLSQCLAHQAIGGCGLRTGDLIATGTVSGPNETERGCLMEHMRQSVSPQRGYLEDGETIILSGFCGDGVGFGECVATLMPARDLTD
ncbi:hypothetical protein D0859_14349 [Hortaea werneckii]|uniref:Fumarylacetoacetase n=1 Tax=Hortaea werneckii TaxID=91943 RepID=A0A3M7I858_HORWE|nr:hypothetical protein D0859_14349 [Hortaea werneckii]